MVPRKMCGETPKTGNDRMLVEVWMSSGPKRSRSDSHDGDQAHGHGKEDTPTLHAGRSEIPRKEIGESVPKSLN